MHVNVHGNVWPTRRFWRGLHLLLEDKAYRLVKVAYCVT
jgi:hypothetical protein